MIRISFEFKDYLEASSFLNNIARLEDKPKEIKLEGSKTTLPTDLLELSEDKSSTEPKVHEEPKKANCKWCGKEFEKFANNKFCSHVCKLEYNKDYQRKYRDLLKGDKDKTPPERPRPKHMEKTCFVPNSVAEKNHLKEKAKERLEKLKKAAPSDKTQIYIAELKATFEVNRKMTPEEIANFRLEKLKSRMDQLGKTK